MRNGISKSTKLKTIVLSVTVSLFLVAGTTYAWNSVWRNPIFWVSNGSAVRADRVGESLQYLYDALQSRNAMEGLNCTSGQIMRWGESGWACASI